MAYHADRNYLSINDQKMMTIMIIRTAGDFELQRYYNVFYIFSSNISFLCDDIAFGSYTNSTLALNRFLTKLEWFIRDAVLR